MNKLRLRSPRIVAMLMMAVFCFVVNSYAQETVSEVSTDGFPQSLDALASHFSKMETIEASFVQSRYLSLLKKPLISEGLFNYSRGKNICWRISTPVPAVVELTPSNVRIADNASDNKMGAINPAVKHFTNLFFAVFSGDFELLDSDFDMVWGLTEDHWSVTLSPKDETVAAIAEKFVIKGGLSVSEVALIQHNGDKTLLSFTDVVAGTALNKSSFECRASEG